MGVQISNELENLVIPRGSTAVKNALTLEILVTQKNARYWTLQRNALLLDSQRNLGLQRRES